MVKNKLLSRYLKFQMFDTVNFVVVALIAFLMLYPFLNVISVSFSSYSAYLENPLMIIPKGFNINSFLYVFSNPLIQSGYLNTIFITVVGSILGTILTITTSYALSKRGLPGKKFFMTYIVFTSLFNGGIIPSFYLIRSIGLLNSLWALILPTMLVSFNIILMKNFFEGLPESLEEAAKIDGAGDIRVLIKIIMPISKPIIATIALFTVVAYWNSYFNAILYIRDQSKWTLQLVLREIISAAETQSLQSGGNMAEIGASLPTQSLKYATLVVVILPILAIYPFLQKYFVTGITVGAVKG